MPLFRILPTKGPQKGGSPVSEGDYLVLPLTSLKGRGEATERFLGA